MYCSAFRLVLVSVNKTLDSDESGQVNLKKLTLID